MGEQGHSCTPAKETTCLQDRRLGGKKENCGMNFLNIYDKVRRMILIFLCNDKTVLLMYFYGANRENKFHAGI